MGFARQKILAGPLIFGGNVRQLLVAETHDNSTHYYHFKKREKGIEPSYVAWKATVLPLNYSRMNLLLSIIACPAS